jgi:hypothetical protein
MILLKDVIAQEQILMLFLSDGRQVFVLGQSIERAVRLVNEAIDHPRVKVMAVFDGRDMYFIEWDE